ncbi:hypothetical protein CEXT_757921 [Caerostris extrusa]|uniref:Uncharacterized protein n=1 Tax=Caerostris extrusa TaxID=172846 RepID=A0AAV4P5G0_CAEEX|nr:hypothetical protein CEXT_757921 [Caerostris extrusa]
MNTLSVCGKTAKDLTSSFLTGGLILPQERLRDLPGLKDRGEMSEHHRLNEGMSLREDGEGFNQFLPHWRSHSSSGETERSSRIKKDRGENKYSFSLREDGDGFNQFLPHWRRFFLRRDRYSRIKGSR